MSSENPNSEARKYPEDKHQLQLDLEKERSRRKILTVLLSAVSAVLVAICGLLGHYLDLLGKRENPSPTTNVFGDTYNGAITLHSLSTNQSLKQVFPIEVTHLQSEAAAIAIASEKPADHPTAATDPTIPSVMPSTSDAPCVGLDEAAWSIAPEPVSIIEGQKGGYEITLRVRNLLKTPQMLAHTAAVSLTDDRGNNLTLTKSTVPYNMQGAPLTVAPGATAELSYTFLGAAQLGTVINNVSIQTENRQITDGKIMPPVTVIVSCSRLKVPSQPGAQNLSQ